MKKWFYVSALAFTCSQALAIDLSPNALGGSGAIPGTYPSVTFSLSDGNWVPKVTLPAVGLSNAEIILKSSAGYTSELVTTNSDIPVTSLTINANDQVKFVFNANTKQWIYTPSKFRTPNTDGANFALTTDKITQYKLWDGNWVGNINLPATSTNGAMVWINSNATWQSAVNPTNLMYASSFNVRKSDNYLFSFRSDLARWVPVKSPTKELAGSNLNAPWQLPKPVMPVTHAVIGDGYWHPSIVLPSTAGDRDRMVIQSLATWGSMIASTHVDFGGTMKMATGQTYEFMFIKERNLWVLQASPKTNIPASSGFSLFKLPDQSTPVMTYTGKASAATSIMLPNIAKNGDQVIVNNEFATTFSVKKPSGVDLASMGVGDTQRFIYDSAGWRLETNQVKMMLVYSDTAAQRLGDSAMQLRMQESLRLTNEALENSGANFYVKHAGFLRYQIPASTMGDELKIGRTDTVVQSRRAALGADAVYYAGTSEGCGLGWFGPTQFSMLAAENIGCGTTVMRHEFGHNMGLDHCDGGMVPYAHGNAKTADVMCGNAIPYYSTPKLFTKDVGLPLGIEDQLDSVRRLNDQSSTVANFFK